MNLEEDGKLKSYTNTKNIWEANATESNESDLLEAKNYLLNLPSLVGKGPSTTLILDLKTSQFKAVIGDFKNVLGVEYKENMNMSEVASFIHPDHSALMEKYFPTYLNHIVKLSPESRNNVDLSVIFKFKRNNNFYWLSFRAFKYFSSNSSLGYIILEYTDITDIKTDKCAKFIVYDKDKGYIINESFYSDCSKLDTLTPTELAITKLIAKGLSDKEIADVQSSSIYTIKEHKKHIFTKMQINKSTELVALAYEFGLVT